MAGLRECELISRRVKVEGQLAYALDGFDRDVFWKANFQPRPHGVGVLSERF